MLSCHISTDRNAEEKPIALRAGHALRPLIEDTSYVASRRRGAAGASAAGQSEVGPGLGCHTLCRRRLSGGRGACLGVQLGNKSPTAGPWQGHTSALSTSPRFNVNHADFHYRQLIPWTSCIDSVITVFISMVVRRGQELAVKVIPATSDSCPSYWAEAFRGALVL